LEIHYGSCPWLYCTVMLKVGSVRFNFGPVYGKRGTKRDKYRYIDRHRNKETQTSRHRKRETETKRQIDRQ